MKLRHIAFNRMHFLVTKFQTEKHFQALISAFGKETFAFTAAEHRSERTVQTPDLENRILDDVFVYPGISIQRITAEEHIAHSTVWWVLREQPLYPNHVQQIAHPQNYPGRVEFCQWLLHNMLVILFFSTPHAVQRQGRIY
jgi:hypothetical protein